MDSLFIKKSTNKICNFFTLDAMLVGKVSISLSWRKIHFPTISEQAPLKDTLSDSSMCCLYHKYKDITQPQIGHIQGVPEKALHLYHPHF